MVGIAMPFLLWFFAVGIAMGNLKTWHTDRVQRLALEEENARMLAELEPILERHFRMIMR